MERGMKYSILHQFDLEPEVKCECRVCTFRFNKQPILKTSIVLSVFLPVFWIVPIGILGYERYLYQGSYQITDFKHHELNQVRTRSLLFYLIIGVMIHMILLSFIVLGVIANKAESSFDESKVILGYL